MKNIKKIIGVFPEKCDIKTYNVIFSERKLYNYFHTLRLFVDVSDKCKTPNYT